MKLSQITPLLSLNPHLKRIALQFPDDLLPDSDRIYFTLQSLNPSLSFFILADTSFGSCCVDEIAAEHVQADLVIHFGRSCFSSPSRIEVWWVLPEINDNLKPLKENFEANSVVVVSDVPIENFSSIFSQNNPNYIEAQIVDRFIPGAPREENLFFSRKLKSPLPLNGVGKQENVGYCVLFVGESESPTYAHLMLTEAASKGISIWHLGIPSSIQEIFRRDVDLFCSQNIPNDACNSQNIPNDACTPQTIAKCTQFSRSFVKRLACIQKIKSAQIYGLLLGTATTKGTLEVLSQVKCILQAAPKQFYTFYLGKLNPAKLGNFLEIDAFIWIGCPQASIIYDQSFYSQFHRPIVTPVELIMALEPESTPFGTIAYNLDFEGFLLHQEHSSSSCMSQECTEVCSVDSTNKKMALFTSRRQFQGLAYEISPEQQQKTEIQKGRSGIAGGYANEKAANT